MGSPKWLGDSLNFQFNGIVVVSPGTKCSRSADYTILETQNKHFASGSLGVIVSDVTLISILQFLGLWILTMGETVPNIGNWFIALKTFCRPLLQPCKWLHLTATVTESSKGHSIILLNHLLHVGGKHGTTNEFHENESVSAPHVLWNEFLDQNQCCA